MRNTRSICLLVLVFSGGLAASAQEPGSVPEGQAPPAAAAPSTARAIRVSAGVIASQRLGGDQPVYPPDAKSQGISGSVVLRALIGRDGSVQSLTVVSGNSLLSEAALNAVKTWIYKPYLLNGQPTEVDTTITVNFNLSPDSHSS